MIAQPEKLDLRSHDLINEKMQELLRLFPEIRTEGGQIDFDRLKLVLGESVDMGKERYGLNWPGKADCFKTIQAPSLGTLRPCSEESVNFDTTENLVIEGDNLEVLKLLQKSYLGKVKMIYIDPPYNTGNDFIYPDNYTESLQTYLEYTGQVDGEGRKFGSNTDTDGRFHSKWLNMMYPRLYLARNLLQEDGLIFVSVDDHEFHALRLLLMNEVFGEENWIESLVWKRSYGGGAKEKYAVSQHEYVLLYARNVESIAELWLPPNPEVERRYYKYQDGKFEKRGPYRLQPLEAAKSMDRRENLVFPIPLPWGGELMPKRQWLWQRERVLKALAESEIVFTRDADNVTASYKQYLLDEQGGQRGTKPVSVIDGIYTQRGTDDLNQLFGGRQMMPFPKPVALLKTFVTMATLTEREGIILDFFAGSGTIAQAALELNQQDGGRRSFILVQLPEPTGDAELATIAEITKERVRRVINKLIDSETGQLPLGSVQDRGFRAFKLAESNFKPWNAQVAHDTLALEQQLEMHIDHIRAGRTTSDILYEILLKSGFPLATPVETLTMEGQTVYSIAGGALFICLEQQLTLDLIRAMAEQKPERVVCLDEGFAGNDQLKANAVQIFKTKGIASFKTV